MCLNPPLALPAIRDPAVIARFMRHIDHRDGRWLWTGARDRKGYGRFRLGRHMLCAHRVSFAIFVGPIPEGHHVHHIAPDPSNVPPDIRRAVTLLENTHHSNARHRLHRLPTATDIPI